MTQEIDLKQLGWRPEFEDAFEPYSKQGLWAARVAEEHRGAYVVHTKIGEMTATSTGAMRFEAAGREDLPVVGDWVVIEPRVGEMRATIRAILPRRSAFARKIAGVQTEQQVLASNVDVVFLMSALDTDLNPRRVERYLTMAWASGATPVVVLSKADLCDDVDAAVAVIARVAPGVEIHVISSIIKQGLDVLQRYLGENNTVAVLGSSGVGKSTLINELSGHELQKVEAIRDDGRGRHTTTHRQLIRLPQGGLVIDTPGIRELQLWDDKDGLQETFEDIAELAHSCRFRDCLHHTEPGCAVLAALADGSLPLERLQSYNKLKKELRHLHIKQDRREAALEKRRWKTITKDYRKHVKGRR